MSLQDKLPGWVLLAHGAFGVLWTLQIALQIGFPWSFVVANLVLAAIGIAAGVCWFFRRHWGACLGVLYFLVQLVHVFTAGFQWSFTLGFAINVSLGWIDSVELGLNLFAFVMLMWIGWRGFAPRNSHASPA